MLRKFFKEGYSLLTIMLLVFTTFNLHSQCTTGYTTGNLTVSSPCTIGSNITISGNLVLNANLTISPGVVVTVTGAVTNSYTGSARTITVSGGRINSATLTPGQNTTLALSGTIITTTAQCAPQYNSGLTLTNSTLNIGTFFSDNIQQNSVTVNNSTLTTGTTFTLSGNTGLNLTNGSSMTIGGAMQLNGGTGKQFGVCATCTVNADSFTSGGAFTMNLDGDVNVTNAISLTSGSQILNINGSVDAGSISHTNGKTVNIGSAGSYSTTGSMTASGAHTWAINGDLMVGSFSGSSASTVTIASSATFNSTGSITTSAGYTWNINGALNSTTFNSSAASNYNLSSTALWNSSALNFTNGNQTVTMGGNINTGPLTTSGSASFTLNPNAGSLGIGGDITVGGGNFTINGGNGDITMSGALNINNGNFSLYDTLSVPGNIVANSGNNVQVFPEGRLIAQQNLTINSDESLIVGTNVAPPPYADLIVFGDVNSLQSGDITVNQNGRVAIFGDINDDGQGGTFLQVQNGGQMYVDGDINFTGGGNTIINNNSSDPYGLYVNGDINQSGGGSSTTGNVGDRSDMTDSNPDFEAWVGESIVPVELLYFSGKRENGVVVLSWRTASEQNNDFFSIERSLDGENFDLISKVDGFGTTKNVTDYSFSDFNSTNGMVYYRLCQTDFDGSMEMLKVIVMGQDFSLVKVYPNPLGKDRLLKIQGAPVDSSYEIVDLTGKSMLVGNLESELDLSSLKKGNYILTIQTRNSKVSKRILVK